MMLAAGLVGLKGLITFTTFDVAVVVAGEMVLGAHVLPACALAAEPGIASVALEVGNAVSGRIAMLIASPIS